MVSESTHRPGESIEPLLHIGYHKTATSWLQHWIFVPGNGTFWPLSTPEYRPELAQSFYYGVNGRPISPYDENEEVIDSLLNEALGDDGSSDGRIPVLSHEYLSGDPHMGGRESRRIAQRLNRTFPHGKVLIGIREQASFLASSYFQYLWMGGTLGVRSYLESGQRGKRPYFAPEFLDYVPLISHYQELFGADNVLVLPYEQFERNMDSYFSRLGSFVEAEIDIPEESRNSRLGAKRDRVPLYYLRPANRLRWATPLNDYSALASPIASKVYRRASLSLAWRIPDRVERRLVSRVRSEINGWVADRYASSNSALAALIGVDLGELGYPLSRAASRTT